VETENQAKRRQCGPQQLAAVWLEQEPLELV
jgi:hypothetical protein